MIYFSLSTLPSPFSFLTIPRPSLSLHASERDAILRLFTRIPHRIVRRIYHRFYLSPVEKRRRAIGRRESSRGGSRRGVSGSDRLGGAGSDEEEMWDPLVERESEEAMSVIRGYTLWYIVAIAIMTIVLGVRWKWVRVRASARGRLCFFVLRRRLGTVCAGMR